VTLFQSERAAGKGIGKFRAQKRHIRTIGLGWRKKSRLKTVFVGLLLGAENFCLFCLIAGAGDVDA